MVKTTTASKGQFIAYFLDSVLLLHSTAPSVGNIFTFIINVETSVSDKYGFQNNYTTFLTIFVSDLFNF